MILSEAQQVFCVCGSVGAALDDPDHAANALISGPRSQFRWICGSELVEDSEGWQYCSRCGTTVAHLEKEVAGLVGFINQPLDAIHQAVEARDFYKVQELLARGVPADLEIRSETPLMLAVEKGELEICRILLEHGALARLAITREFFAQKSPELLSMLVEHGVRPQRLVRSILMEGDTESAKILLAGGVDLSVLDVRGFTPLHCAAHNSAEMVRLIAAHTNDFTRLSRGGGHALGFCALWGFTNRLRVLLEAGFPVDALQENPPDSALFAACREGNPSCVRVLLKFGADPNLRCADVTPLMAASHSGSLACVEMLLEAGADPGAMDASGRAARDFAVTPAIRGQHRFSSNSAGEARVELSYGRGRWTCCHEAIAARLPGDGPIGDFPLLKVDGTRLHSMDFTESQVRGWDGEEADWQIIHRAASAGCVIAQTSWGSYTSKLGWLRTSARQKWAEGLLELSRISFRRDGRMVVRYGRQKNQPALVLAAELGSLEAMRDLAATLIHDEYDRTGNRADGYAKALPWYIRAAEGGHRESQVAGGSMLIQGDGAEPDPVRGLRFLEAAAGSDDVDNATAAASQLARYYKGCYSLSADPAKAAYWAHRAATLKLEDDLRMEEICGYSSRLRSP